MQQEKSTRDISQVVLKLGCGGTASIIAKTMIAPFERTKLILQTSTTTTRATTISTMRSVFAEQGIASFWRGNFTNCLRVFPTSALRFTLFDTFQDLVTRDLQDSEGNLIGEAKNSLPLSRQICAGALAGGTTMLFVYPLDLLRTQLSANMTKSVSSSKPGLVSLTQQILKKEGFRGFYRGIGIAVIEISPYVGVSLGGYEYLKSVTPLENSKYRNLLLGWLSGVTASLVCYPMDTVKRVIMINNQGGGGQNSSSSAAASVINCVFRIFKKHGIRGFYRGCAINALNSGPAAALTLVANEMLRARLLSSQAK